VRSILLKTARQVFIEEGFVGANMRDIAKNAGVSVGNMYNYFPNKDALFHEVVRPTLEAVDNAFELYEAMDILSDEYLWGLDYHYKFVEEVVNFLDLHRENLKLILFHSQRSALEMYKELCIQKYTAIMIRIMAVLRTNFPDAVLELSDFFIHTVSSLYAHVVTELLMHDLMREEMQTRLKELMTFLFYGWNSLMDSTKIFSAKKQEI
jgi:TetR/AcrR family transcriptional regulator, cholesterol catabolism regulator